MKVVVNKLKILGTHFEHTGLVISPIEIKLKQAEPQYINNLGNWKPNNKNEYYLAKIPIKIIKLIVSASENQKLHYNPSNVPKPHEQFKRLGFPFIWKCRNTLNALDASDTRPTARACSSTSLPVHTK